MADQTSVRFRNGAGEAPATELLKNLSDCAHDMVGLAELQARLLRLDLQESARQTAAPAGLLTAGAAMLLGVFPVLLMTVAYALIEGAGWPAWAGFLLATGAGLLVGGGFCGGAYWMFRKSVIGLERSRKELSDNIRWLKEVLGKSGRIRQRRQCD